jgi:hypothetical protein
MAIVPIRDEYTDSTAGLWQMHTPVSLDNGTFVAITDKHTSGGGPDGMSLRMVSSDDAPAGPQARLYTQTATGWTRGDPTALTVDCINARASAATLDGNVLTQGEATVETVTYAPAASETTGPSRDMSPTRTHPLTQTLGQLLDYTGPGPLQVTAVHVGVLDGTNVSGAATIRARICWDVSGSLLPIAEATHLLVPGSTTYQLTFSEPVFLQPSRRYYVLLLDLTAAGGSDEGFWELTSDTNASTPAGGVLASLGTFVDGDLHTGPGVLPVWFSFDYWRDAYPVTTTVTATGYTVLDVNPTTKTIATAPVALAPGGDLDAWGRCATEPDAMARIPGTNRFWAWRSYPDPGMNLLDLLQVTGTHVDVIATAAVGPVGTHAYPPHAIIPLNATEAISLLSTPDEILLVHVVVAGTTLTVSTQPVVGYPPADDATLVPGLNFQAELLVKANSSEPLTLARLGLTWHAGSFTITTLPIVQLTAGTKPPDYSPRNANYYVRITSGSTSIARNGALVVARQFFDAGSNDNWVLLTQYDQSTGNIVASTWSKGDRNGSTKDYLWINDLSLRFDVSTSRLILAGTESYEPLGASVALVQAARLGVYRLGYVLDGTPRSDRQRFER